MTLESTVELQKKCYKIFKKPQDYIQQVIVTNYSPIADLSLEIPQNKVLQYVKMMYIVYWISNSPQRQSLCCCNDEYDYRIEKVDA